MAATDILHALRSRMAASIGPDRSRSAPPALADRAPRLGAVGAVLCVGAVVVAASGVRPEAAFGRGLLELLIVGVPIATGLYALRVPVDARFGIALVAVGFSWSLTALSESSASVPYTIGRLSTWLVFPGVVYLLLAFPDARIARGLDRWLLAATVLISVFLFFGTAPLVLDYPPHTLWASCTTDCPANAIAVVDAPPSWLPGLVRDREWLVVALWAGLFVSMFRRWRGASALRRPAMSPVFVCAVALGVCHIAFHLSRQFGAPAQTVIALSDAWTMCIVATCVAVFFGLFWRRTLLAGALARLGVSLQAGDGPAAVPGALAVAVGDPGMRVWFRDRRSGAWRDADGQPVTWPPVPGPGRTVTTAGGGPLGPEVALVHDVALHDDRELLDGVGSMVLAGWRHEQLMVDLSRAMSDLAESRQRIAKAADVERARVERDLHDGAQQRLIALGLRLQLAEERFKRDPAAGGVHFHELGLEVERSLDELRSLARGVYPSILLDRGLADALRSLALVAPVPIHVITHGVTRHPVEIESAVYFACAEALQNALKHAAGRRGISITLDQSDRLLRFEVRDHGAGFAPSVRDGSGLRNMQDRMEAIGGRLTIDSRPGEGTCVIGSLELPVETRAIEQ